MPFPFRTPASQEDTWEPPDYAVPVKASSDNEEWTPPSYATPVKKEEKKGPSALSKVVEALKPAKIIKPTGSLIPEALKTEEMKAIGKPPQPPVDYGKRPDGTQKGEGFLGMFKLPNNSVASEYSIANSEKLKDEKGNYLDYPSLVPTLTREEVQAVLKAAAEGKPVPQSVEAKAEAHALKRKAEGRSLFAQPGEEDYTQHMDLSRAPHYESDEEKAAKKKTRPEEDKKKRDLAAFEAGIRDREKTSVVGVDQNKISDIASKLPERWHGIPIRYPAAFLGSLAGTAIETLSDPLNIAVMGAGAGLKAGTKAAELPIRRSREIPYRMEEPISAPRITETPKAAVEAPKPVEPIATKAEEVPAVEEKKPFVSPFEKKTEKPLEQTFGEFGGVGHPDEPEYANKVLARAGKGEPGLAVEPVEGLDNVNHVVYRNKDGEPIAAAMVVKDQSGKTLVQDLAADKSKGLLTGRAMKALGGKLEELGATESSGTMSADAENFLAKMKERSAKSAKEIESLSEWKPPEYAKPVEINASGESAASQEAINRQASMKSKGEQYVVYDRAGNARPLIGPEAVDYQPRPGETFGIITPTRGFRVLESRGGKIPGRAGLAEFITSESGGMRWEGPVPGGGEVFEGPQGRVLNKLFNALEDAKGRVSEQADINRVERARRFAASASVKEEGAAGAAKSLSKLRGEFEKVNPGERLQLDQKDTDSLFTAIKKANITEPEKDRGYAALFKLLTGEKTPVRSDLQVLNDVFGNGFADKVIEMHGGLGMVGLKVSKLASTMKSMQNAFSLAPPVRHGLGLMGQKSFYPAARDYFKFYANKEFYNASMKAIEEHPDYLWARDAGLYISKPGSVMGAEEEFLNSYIGNVPRFTGIPMAVGASQRSYSGFLNKARFDTLQAWKKMAEGLGHKMSAVTDYIDTSDQAALRSLRRDAGKQGIKDVKLDNPEFVEFAKKQGITKQMTYATPEAKKLANFINIATGRGDLGSLNKLTNELNIAMWSPRMVTSRIQMLNPKLYMDLPKGMRLEGLKSLFSVAALGASVTALTAAAGAKVSNNILSTDFMKSRFGKHVIDPWGGFQQYIVAAARFLAGKTDSPLPTSRLDIAGRFLKTRESPIGSLIHTILTAKAGSQGKEGPGTFETQYGQQTSIQRETVRSFEPILIQGMQDLVQSEPDWSENVGLTAAMVAAGLTGMAQEYPEKKTGKLQFRKMKVRP